jgi:hypothetical protein
MIGFGQPAAAARLNSGVRAQKMTPSEFVDALRAECADAAVSDCLRLFQSPPGRKPAQSLVTLSNWYRGLDPDNQANVVAAMRQAADATLFGVLCVLDVVRAVEHHQVKSEFKPTATRNGSESVISPGPEQLHDILRAEP